MTPISVECTFAADGRIQVRRMAIDGRWLVVEQGRQWRDQSGRHVLVMVHGGPGGHGGTVRELILRPETLTWELVNNRTGTHVA